MTDVPQDKCIDVHVDLPPETLADIKSGRKVLTVADKNTGDSIAVSQKSVGYISWKQAGMFLAILSGLAGNIWFAAHQFSELQHAVQGVPDLKNQIADFQKEVSSISTVVVEHGKELSFQEKMDASVLELYRELKTDLNTRTADRFKSVDAQRERELHSQIHEADRRTYATELKAIRTEIELLRQEIMKGFTLERTTP